MKRFILNFIKRGAMFAWSGPAVLCIVWLCLNASGVVTAVTIPQAVLAVVTTTLIAFTHAGITCIYQVERLPKAIAALIQLACLYAVYAGGYLLNGWMRRDVLLVFTICFIIGFALIWLIVYLSTKRSVKKLNAKA